MLMSKDPTSQHQWRNLPPIGHAQNGVCGPKDQAWTWRAFPGTIVYRVDQLVLCEALFDEQYTTYYLSRKGREEGDAINDYTYAAGAFLHELVQLSHPTENCKLIPCALDGKS